MAKQKTNVSLLHVLAQKNQITKPIFIFRRDNSQWTCIISTRTQRVGVVQNPRRYGLSKKLAGEQAALCLLRMLAEAGITVPGAQLNQAQGTGSKNKDQTSGWQHRPIAALREHCGHTKVEMPLYESIQKGALWYVTCTVTIDGELDVFEARARAKAKAERKAALQAGEDIYNGEELYDLV